MSGVRLLLTIQSRDLQERLATLAGRLGDLRPVLAALGEDLLAGAQESFDRETAPSGASWEKSRRAKTQGGQTLRLTGRLYASLQTRVGPDRVAVGTNVIYAAVHQFGAAQGAFGTSRRGQPLPWGDIPARPYLGVSAVTRAAITETLARYLKAGAQGG